MRGSSVLIPMLFLTAVMASDAQQMPEAPRDPHQAEMERKVEKDRNKERQAQIQKDTAELLALATQLKKSVDASNEHVLSLDVIRTTEKIEKLAHKIRDKMKAGGYQPGLNGE